MKLNRTPNPLDRNARNGENDNWEKIEGSIKRIDDTVSDLVLESGGTSNLEVVQARGGKPVLNDRLNSIDSQLNETVKKGEGGVITPEMASQELKEQMTGGSVAVVGKNTVLRENIVDEQVYPEKTTFAKSKNLAGELVENFSLGGPFESMEFRGTEGSQSYINKLESGKTYTISKSPSDRFRVATNLEYPEVGKPVERPLLIGDSETKFTFTLEPNENYVIVYVATAEGSPPTEFQIEEGAEATPYTRPGEVVSINFKEKSIDTRSIKDIRANGILYGNPNAFSISLKSEKITTTGGVGGVVGVGNSNYDLIDGEWSYSGWPAQTVVIGFNKNNGNIVFLESSSVVEKENDDIAVLGAIRKNNQTYFINGFANDEDSRHINYGFAFLSGSASSFNISLQDEKITTIRGGGFVHANGTRYNLIDGEWSYSGFPGQSVIISFDVTNSNIKFLRGSEVTESDVILGVIRRNHETYFVNGIHSFEGEVSKPYKNNDHTPPEVNGIFIADNASGNYESNTEFIEPVRDLDTLYGIYDDLVTRFPDYVSRTFLKNDEAGLPLYRYDFKPTEIQTGIDLPKIIYTCTHGHENFATYGGALFFKELCERWKDDDIIRLMRWNIHFIVVPNLNPWGFNEGSRPNFNGVDLARNYSAGWSPEYTDIGYDYPGTEPLSEVGTQVMDSILQENTDAFFVIDHHNYGGDPFDGGNLLWTGSLDDSVRDMQKQYVHNMVVQSKKLFDIDEGVQLGRNNTTLAGGSTGQQFNHYGIKGFIIENTNRIRGVQGEEALTFNINSVGNAVISAIKYYSR